jgi:hypothetical protein
MVILGRKSLTLKMWPNGFYSRKSTVCPGSITNDEKNLHSKKYQTNVILSYSSATIIMNHVMPNYCVNSH